MPQLSAQISCTRRTLLRRATASAASAALAACGGGGGSGGTPSSGGGVGNATGFLVYRNSGVAGVFDLRAGRELQFDPGENLSLDPGISVSATGIVSVARGGDNQGFDFALHGLDGRERSVHRYTSELAFQTSAVMFNADASRVAFSFNGLTSASDSTRIDRTVVAQWPSGQVLAVLDGLEEPVWAAATGELVVRRADTKQLRLFDANLNAQGSLGGITVSNLIGGVNLSADGRFVVWEDGSRVLAYDRANGSQWVAAADSNSSTHAPCISPDGRHLAVLARDLLVYVPHVVPFVVGATVPVDSALHALDTIADCRARFGWTA
jgi:hypothetical protein